MVEFEVVAPARPESGASSVVYEKYLEEYGRYIGVCSVAVARVEGYGSFGRGLGSGSLDIGAVSGEVDADSEPCDGFASGQSGSVSGGSFSGAVIRVGCAGSSVQSGVCAGGAGGASDGEARVEGVRGDRVIGGEVRGGHVVGDGGKVDDVEQLGDQFGGSRSDRVGCSSVKKGAGAVRNARRARAKARKKAGSQECSSGASVFASCDVETRNKLGESLARRYIAENEAAEVLAKAKVKRNKWYEKSRLAETKFELDRMKVESQVDSVLGSDRCATLLTDRGSSVSPDSSVSVAEFAKMQRDLKTSEEARLESKKREEALVKSVKELQGELALLKMRGMSLEERYASGLLDHAYSIAGESERPVECDLPDGFSQLSEEFRADILNSI